MKIENEWEMCTSVEDIIFRESETGRNYSLKTLQSVYKDFKRLIKKCTFQLPPSFILDELVENGVKTYVFIYRCTDKDGNEIDNRRGLETMLDDIGLLEKADLFCVNEDNLGFATMDYNVLRQGKKDVYKLEKKDWVKRSDLDTNKYMGQRFQDILDQGQVR